MKTTTELDTGTAFIVATDPLRPRSITQAMRERTAALHAQAEQSGVVRTIIAGSVTRQNYALFMRNLLPVYQEMESGLARHQRAPGLNKLFRRELLRAAAIENDLIQLVGANWEDSLPWLASGELYARRIAKAAAGDGALLIAHAYTRYLGDLAGGQVLKRRLAAATGLSASCLSFYDFPGLGNAKAFAGEYRAALDAAAAVFSDTASIVEEAASAFALNIELSKAVR